MKIKAKCERPKYAAGNYEFSKFEELFHWLVGIKSLSKGAVGAILYHLAERGCYKNDMDIETDFKQNYFVIRDLGYKAGLLKTRNMDKYISKDRAVALQFAKELDNLNKG